MKWFAVERTRSTEKRASASRGNEAAGSGQRGSEAARQPGERPDRRVRRASEPRVNHRRGMRGVRERAGGRAGRQAGRQAAERASERTDELRA